mgnify:CR=1 FL=1
MCIFCCPPPFSRFPFAVRPTRALAVSPSYPPFSAEQPKTPGTVNQSYMRRRREHTPRPVEERKAERMAKKVVVKKEKFVRAERIVAKSRFALGSELRIKRHRNAPKAPVAPEGTPVLVAVRVPSRYGLSPKVQVILNKLGLRTENMLSFIPLTPLNTAMMQIVDQHITWGVPTHRMLSDLITKRGFAKVNGGRVALSNNTMIEAALGQFGVICLEDIVHEIFTAGPNMARVVSYLWPFRLNSPPGGWKEVRTSYAKGGALGDRKGDINKLIRSMC